MKSKNILLSTTGAGILLTGVLYFAPSQPKHEGVKLVRDTTTARTAEMISPFGSIEAPGVQNISPKIAQDMSTNTDVSDIADSDIATIIALQKFEREQKEIYDRVHESPLWNRGPQGKESVLYGRLELLRSLSLRLDQLDVNPGLEQQLTKLGFSRNNLVTDDWSQGQGIYGVIDTLREIDALSTEAKEKFFASDVGKNYLAGNIKIQDIENYLHEHD